MEAWTKSPSPTTAYPPGQFLKLANLIDTGADAKFVIADGEVEVNGEVETRRGRQLRDGDVVELGGISVRVSAGGSGA